MEKIKITSGMVKAINKAARKYIGGFGLSVEVSERVAETEPDRPYYFNRLRENDDESDSADLHQVNSIIGKEVELINGELMLDAIVWKYDKYEGQIHAGYLYIVFDESGEVDRIYEGSVQENNIVFKK